MANIKISDLPPITLPAVGADTFFETQTVEGGEDVSRKISLDEIITTTGLDATFVTVTANAQLPNERILTAGTGIAITDNGPNSTIVVEATSGGLSGLGVWRYRTETTSPPASGQIRFNNADPELATELFIAETNDGGTDVSAFLALLTDGSLIYIQEQANSANFIIVEVDTNTDSGTFATIGIQAVVQQGAALSQNVRVIVVVNIVGDVIPDPLLLSDGSAAAPTYSFSGDPDTGVFLLGTNTLAFAAAGVAQFVIDNTSLSAVVAGGPLIRNFDATGVVPNIIPDSGDVNTGIGANGPDLLSLIAGGTEAARASLIGGNTQLTVTDGIVTSPGLAFITDLNTGLARLADDAVSLVGGGVEIARATEAAAANQFAIAQSGSSSVPELTSLADSDTGFRWPANNETVWIGGGSDAWNFSTAKFFSSFSNGPALMNEISSATNPTVVPDHSDPNTGIGHPAGGDELSIIAGGIEAIRIEEVASFITVTYFGTLVVPTASAGAAAVGFDGDLDTGYFSPVDDAIAITAGGIEAQRWAELSGGVIQTNQNDVGLTASVTQTQAGGLALLSSYNEVATVGTTGDALTAFTVVAGTRLIVINNGANSLQLFPAVGDNIGAGVDTAISIAAGDIGIFIGRDATNWDTLYNAAPSPGGGAGGVLPAGTIADSSLKWDGVSAWVEETQVAFPGGATGLKVFDLTLGDFITMGHNGTTAGFSVNAATTEVIFGQGGGPSTGWRFNERVRFPDASAALPGIAFITGGTDGFYRAAGPAVGTVVGGVEHFRVSNANTFVFSDDFRLQPNIGADLVRMIVNGPSNLNDFEIELTSLIDIHVTGSTGERFVLEEFNLAMVEKAAAPGDVAGVGQWWVRDDVPNTAMFTNDAGVDKSLVNDAVQARRTSNLVLTTAFVDVTLDVTDIETDSAVLDHDLATNTDNIIVGQPGTYRIHYGVKGDPTVTTNRNMLLNGRVRLNDAGTGILGSVASTGFFNDSSIDGEAVPNRLDITFYATLAAADFITLQVSKTLISGTDVDNANEITFTAERVL